MKISITTILLTFATLLPVSGMAASDHGGHGAMPSHAGASAATKMVDGQVKKIDKAAGKVTLAHGPLPHLGMNMAMTMVFRVKDAAWLDQMMAGEKIRFAADNPGGVMTVVKFEPAK